MVVSAILAFAVLVLAIVALLALPAWIGVYATRDLPTKWGQAELRLRRATADDANPDAGYRAPLPADRHEVVTVRAQVPRDVTFAPKVSRLGFVVACLAAVPWLFALTTELETGEVGPAATLGLTGMVLAFLQRGARRALVTARPEGARFVRTVGRATLVYHVLTALCVTVAARGSLLPPTFDWLGRGIYFAMLWVGFGVVVGSSLEKAGRRLREAGEPTPRVDVASADGPTGSRERIENTEPFETTDTDEPMALDEAAPRHSRR